MSVKKWQTLVGFYFQTHNPSYVVTTTKPRKAKVMGIGISKNEYCYKCDNDPCICRGVGSPVSVRVEVVHTHVHVPVRRQQVANTVSTAELWRNLNRSARACMLRAVCPHALSKMGDIDDISLMEMEAMPDALAQLIHDSIRDE